MKSFCITSFLLLILSPVLLLAQEQKNTGSMYFEETSYNFGLIPEEKGTVSHTFSFTNTGDRPLVVIRVTTDCGCTTPEYTTDVVEPGKKGFVKVTFDPKGRVGSFIKNIRVYNNDIVKPINIQIRGNVTTLGEVKAGEYVAQLGPLKASTSRLVFPIVSPFRKSAVRLVLYNNHNFPLEARVVNTPKGITASNLNISFGPHEPIELIFEAYFDDSIAPGIYDKPVDIAIFKGDEKIVQTQLWLHLPIAPLFPGINDSDDLEEVPSPMARLNTWLELGRIPANKPFEGKLEIRNDGKKTLELYSVYSSNADLNVKIEKKNIPAGSKSFISYILTPRSGAGSNFSENIEILMNDPRAPFRKVKILAEVVE